MARTYDRAILSDGEAKEALRKWPLRPRDGWGWAIGIGCGPWVRVLPTKKFGRKNKAADLLVIGMDTAATKPDAMWISLGPHTNFVDVVAVEHCGSRQNFYDKRSRYMPTLHSRQVRFPEGWLDTTVAIQHGGQRTMREVCGKFAAHVTGEQRIPVRHLRVLYALQPTDYNEFHLTPFGPYEFFCPHSSLAKRTSPKLRDFVRRLSTDVHWYTS